MRVFEMWEQVAHQGYQFLKELHQVSGTCSVETLAQRVGMPIARVKAMLRTYKILGGRLTGTEGLDVYKLEKIANAYNAVQRPDRSVLPQLVAVAQAHGSVEETHRALCQQVEKLNGRTRRRADTLAFQRSAGLDGKRQIIGRMEAYRVTAMEAALGPRVAKLRKANPDMPYNVALATALYQKVVEKSEPDYSPCFLIPLADQYRYFADGKIATSAGALVDLEEVVNQELAPTGYACVIAKDTNHVPQSVGVLPIGRIANDSQRLGAVLENLVCAHPECTVPAILCETHHITAWAHGGPTASPNLVSLCRAHNGRNDDDPERVKNGRIERDPANGVAGWVQRHGDPVVRPNQSLARHKGWRAWSLGVYS